MMFRLSFEFFVRKKLGKTALPAQLMKEPTHQERHQDRTTPCNPFPTDVYYLIKWFGRNFSRF
jgi:hypothetical protein